MTLRALPVVLLALSASAALAQNATRQQVFGYKDFAPQAQIDQTFLAVPDAALAGQHLKTLTAEPHIAGSEEDHKTALYVAEKFKAAGLQTQIVEYKVLINLPKKILIEAFGPDGKKLMTGPSPEHVGPEYGGDPFQDDPRITPAFNGASPSGDVTAEAVYANYGTPADFQKLADLGVSVKGKIVLVRYGANYRGIKVYDAQRAGAAGVLIYSDPADDGYFRGDKYPRGPWRPDTAVQRGATQFLPIYPGDATTPGVASTPDLPESKRIAIDKIQENWPSIPVNPLSYHDAAPILQALDGPNVPHEWQGALPFAYHTGQTDPCNGLCKGVTVHMHLEQDTKLRTIWDVVGTIDGTDPAQKDDWVVAGNHRDAWVFGAVDPNSGTAVMLETAHGLGALLKTGWKPKRKVVLCSWDAEEEGLIGSTEWVEDHMKQLDHAVAYFNTDVAVSGPNFSAAAVPSLMQFVREVTEDVASPAGGTVYSQWLKAQSVAPNRRAAEEDEDSAIQNDGHKEVRVGTLGSGSDFTPFLQHPGVPSTDIGSGGPYGVYHSAFDNYHWFTKFADPTFVYEQQQARVFGLEILHMADAEVLPYDYAVYGKAIQGYVTAAAKKAKTANLQDDFTALTAAAARFIAAGTAVRERQVAETGDVAALNHGLRAAEEALLNPAGLPHRDWYKHTIYAPGEFTGYAAVVIPGVNEAIEAKDAARAQMQIDALTSALNKASEVLEQAAK